jgi:hypothetical protein
MKKAQVGSSTCAFEIPSTLVQMEGKYYIQGLSSRKG